MSGHNGLHLPPNLRQQPQSQQMMIATPFNDVQLLAMIASNIDEPPAKAVETAIEIIAQSQHQFPKLLARIRQLGESPAPLG